MTIRAGTALEQIPGNGQRPRASLGGCAVAVCTSQRLTRSPDASLHCVGISAEQARAVIFNQRLHDGLGVTVRYPA